MGHGRTASGDPNFAPREGAIVTAEDDFFGYATRDSEQGFVAKPQKAAGKSDNNE